jgi:hypothetical protein
LHHPSFQHSNVDAFNCNPTNEVKDDEDFYEEI